MRELNILLVEDDDIDAEAIGRLLRKCEFDDIQGVHVTHATYLQKGIEVLEKKHDIDIVLLDMYLPDTTGLDGLLAIQNAAPKLPVIFLTSLKDEAVAMSAIKQGAQDYLFKDKFDSHSIKRAIQYAIQRKQLEEVLITKANFDPLTGLANRAMFESRMDIALARIKRMDGGIGIFFLDLDRFKKVNDTMGHAAGDSLLQQVAERLKQSVRPYDTVARFGGDEFALLIDGITQSSDCAAVAQKIIQRIAVPFMLASKQADIGVSIGIAICMAGENPTREALMQQADKAMYNAKLSSDSDYQFYTAGTHEKQLKG